MVQVITAYEVPIFEKHVSAGDPDCRKTV